MDFTDFFKDKNVYVVADSDLDGIGCTIIFLYYLSSLTRSYTILNTGDRHLDLFNFSIAEKSDVVLFCDITPTKDIYKKLQENNIFTIIVDHHVSQYIDLKEIMNEHYYYDNNECGCSLLYNLIIEKSKRKKRTVYQFVELIKTWDLWQDQSLLWNDALKLNFLHRSCMDYSKESDYDKNNFFIRQTIKKFDTHKRFRFTMQDTVYINKEYTSYEENRKIAYDCLEKRVDNSGNSYLYTECKAKISLIGNNLLKEYKDSGVKYIILRSLYPSAVKKNTISLRSMDDFNVSEIAVIHGGGGHKNASGISFTDKDMYESIKNGNKHLI